MKYYSKIFRSDSVSSEFEMCQLLHWLELNRKKTNIPINVWQRACFISKDTHCVGVLADTYFRDKYFVKKLMEIISIWLNSLQT